MPENNGVPTGQLEIELLTVEDIMKSLKASKSTVHRLIKKGAIPAIPVKAPLDKKWSPLRVRKQDFIASLEGGFTND